MNSSQCSVCLNPLQTFLRLFYIVALLLVCSAQQQQKQLYVDEFSVHGPQELHNLVLEEFIERRKENATETMDMDSPIMVKARNHAVRRISTKSEAELSMRKGVDDPALRLLGDGKELNTDTDTEENNTFASLPMTSSNAKDGMLAMSVNSHGDSNSLVSKAHSLAKAIAFNENLGTGAISQAGALPIGDGQWIKLAEGKLKRDAELSHHGLTWEFGTELAEKRHADKGGLNMTFEQSLLDNMREWVIEGGGAVNFAEPEVFPDGRFRLLAKEDIAQGEAVVSVPFRMIMCRQTARNVLIGQSGKYLGEELAKTFEKDEVWGLAIFVLHEYFKEMNGKGSKWGPYLRTLRIRFLSTAVMQDLRSTLATELSQEWSKSSDAFMWWSTGMDGPCQATTKICRTKPGERHSDVRFNMHQIRWAYWVVKQNAVRIKQVSTGLSFLALVPFYNIAEKQIDSDANSAKGAGVRFELDGRVTIRSYAETSANNAISVAVGNFTDSEFYLRYLHMPGQGDNKNYVNNLMKLKLPGALPEGSKFHFCMKGTTKQRESDECRTSYKSDSMFWRSKVLTEWRKVMNLPPRTQELRMWANRLHLYGTGEEMERMSQTNSAIAGLPLSTDDMPAEEQLMMLGLANDNEEAAAIVAGPAGGDGARATPQLYSAPDPEEDKEALRAMEELAYLAAQNQNAILNGNNLVPNATESVLNRTRDFFLHGVLPMAGLDELDQFLLKKIGMIAHCGFENDMKIYRNETTGAGAISEELMCAMRVHLMNETETNIFCPADSKAWMDNCHDVQFLNFTAISRVNEVAVVNSLQNSIEGLLKSYPTSADDDQSILSSASASGAGMGHVRKAAIQLRLREKDILKGGLEFLEEYSTELNSEAEVEYQLESKAKERAESDEREIEHARFLEEVRARSEENNRLLATVNVDLSGNKKANLTLHSGQDIAAVVQAFCQTHAVPLSYADKLVNALKDKIPRERHLSLLLGVVNPLGHRNVMALYQDANVTVEVAAFCARYNVTSRKSCQGVEERVRSRVEVGGSFTRHVLLTLPIDVPDSRKLLLPVREGDQHQLGQLVLDFCEYYGLSASSADVVVAEINKRLPPVALQIPVGLTSRRQVNLRLAANDNITNVIEGFANVFELGSGDDEMKVQIYRRARYGMAPGTYVV